MKKVFSSAKEVIHIWAQQSQEEGRCSNVFFEGKTIYSYGRHFPAATFHDNNIVLINSHNYSNTTAKHLNWINRSIPGGYREFHVPDPSQYVNHSTNTKYYIDQIIDCLTKASKAKGRKQYYINDAASYQDKLQNYIHAFNITPDEKVNEVLAIPISIDAEIIEQLKEIEKVKQKALLIEKKEKIEDWINGNSQWLPGNIDKVFLRLNGDEVETSKGAKVPEKEARILFNFIETGRDIKGFKIGYYTTIGLQNDTLTIGCHKIDKKEIDRFAKVVGW
jgi:hypothetical protein